MYIERLRLSSGMTRQEVPWSWPWHVYLASIAYHSHFEACFGRSEDKWREISAAQHILGPRAINPDERMGNRQERSDKEKSDCDWLEIIINRFSVSDYLATFTYFSRFKFCMWGPEVLCRTVKACPELLVQVCLCFCSVAVCEFPPLQRPPVAPETLTDTRQVFPLRRHILSTSWSSANSVLQGSTREGNSRAVFVVVCECLDNVDVSPYVTMYKALTRSISLVCWLSQPVDLGLKSTLGSTRPTFRILG